MRIEVKLFAAMRQQVGREAISVELSEPVTVAALRTALAQQYPVLAPWQSHFLVALNHQFASDHHLLQPTDEVACIPPVSGG